MASFQITRQKILAGAGVAAGTPCPSSLLNASTAEDDSLLLWYDKPASEWTEALPIGNGRLGAMIFGGYAIEQLQLNEDTLYAGSPYDPNNPEALKALPEARRLIFAGKYKEAHDLVGAKMMAHPIKQMPYEPVGDFKLLFADHDNVTNYRRQLDLDTGIATTTYTVGPNSYMREIFARPVDQVIVVCLVADRRKQLNFTMTFETPQTASVSTEGNDTLVLSGVNGDSSSIKGGLKFAARVSVQTLGGQISGEKERIVVKDAETALLFIAAATSYRSYKDTSGDPQAIVSEQLKRVSQKTFFRLRAAHVQEHQRLFRRVQLNLGRTSAADLPTD